MLKRTSISLMVCALASTVEAQPSRAAARLLVGSSIAAMGLDAGDRGAHGLRLVGIQHEFILGNAERAEGPWRVAYSRFSELRDAPAARMRRTEWPLRADGSEPAARTLVLTDTVVAIDPSPLNASRGNFEDVVDRLDGAPDRALALALASPGLERERSIKRFGVTLDIVSFPWRNGRMRIELARESHLPMAIDIVRPYPDNFRWAPFGDVRMRTDFVDWQLQPWGGWWPMQYKVRLNGEKLRDVTIASTAMGVPAPADSFAVSDSARAGFVEASRMNFSRFRLGMRGAVSEPWPGIARVPDFWAMTLVKQADGVVLFEAHISAQYLHDVIAEARRRWPGTRIKALVMTSDPWAHLGGVREAMALGIPIYVNARSIPFLSALAKAPHTLLPDSLARVPWVPKLIGVRRKTTLGTGANRVELYPVGGPYGERMTMAYFPERRLLYGADLVFPNRAPDGHTVPGFDKTPAHDLRVAVDRARLAVDSVFCVQNYPHPFSWAEFTAPNQ